MNRAALSLSACTALFTLGFTGCVADREYADQWDQGAQGELGLGAGGVLALGEGAIRGDLGRVIGIDQPASSVESYTDVGYTSLTLNIDRGDNGTGFTTLDVQGVGLNEERFASGEVVVIENDDQSWDNAVYVSMIGCADLGDDHWDNNADKLEIQLDPETPDTAKRVDYRAHFPGQDYGFGSAYEEQTVSGSAVVDLTAQTY
jgi:hypothetical protein